MSHRGGRGFGVDNTLDAMELAAAAGVRRLETDVRQTSDGQPVICHDAGIWGSAVARTTADELRAQAPERPLLSEVLDSLAGWVQLNLEIKAATAATVGEMLEEYGIATSTVVTSFHRNILEDMRASYPQVRTGLLYRMAMGEHRRLEAALAAGASLIAPHFSGIDRRLVEAAHSRGMEVCAWTVNREGDLEQLLEWEVDAVITDRYLDMKAYLEAQDVRVT
ncbi:MAG: glycerophosphodiester phosphodiesterase [Actinomycetota bacterium]